ncbi:MAG TPA: ASCH domain-containing protein [Noviherbaspirillum sp.]|nr:ASCH domain-containing protein [Noviherbaspirillum sp.]
MTPPSLPHSLSAFWQSFAASHGEAVDGRFYEAFHFSDNEQDARELAALVLAGTKRATASLLRSYEQSGQPLPYSGALSIVTNWAGEPVCVIETITVDVLPFDSVPASFAAEEGEGDRSLGWWRDAHWRYFSRACRSHGYEPSATMPVVCERFRVVHVHGQR